MEQIKLVEPKYVTITSSYSEKVMLDNYGIEGQKYSPRDFFMSLNINIPQEEATSDRIRQEADKLNKQCMEIVKSHIENYIEGMKSDSLSGDELKEIAPLIQMIAVGNDIDVAIGEITNRKDSLNEKQLGFLRDMVREAKQ